METGLIHFSHEILCNAKKQLCFVESSSRPRGPLPEDEVPRMGLLEVECLLVNVAVFRTQPVYMRPLSDLPQRTSSSHISTKEKTLWVGWLAFWHSREQKNMALRNRYQCRRAPHNAGVRY